MPRRQPDGKHGDSEEASAASVSSPLSSSSFVAAAGEGASGKRMSLRRVPSRILSRLRRSDSFSARENATTGRASDREDDHHGNDGGGRAHDLLCAAPRPFHHSIREAQGRRHCMEDRTCACVVGDGIDSIGMFGVFDGHGGRLAADYCHAHFVARLRAHAHFEREPRRALRDTCLQLDREILAEALRHRSYAGTTVAFVLVKDHTVYCCNVGDSRTVLCAADNGEHDGDRGSTSAAGDGGAPISTAATATAAAASVQSIALSEDHSPMVPGEIRRIKRAGGFVNARGVNGYISLTRALGDLDMKAHAPRIFPQLNITADLLVAEPDIVVRSIKPHDEFLIVACDGLWCRLSNAEAVRVARHAMRRCAGDPAAAARALVRAALDAGSNDNVSVIVVVLSRPDIMRDITVHGAKLFMHTSPAERAAIRSLASGGDGEGGREGDGDEATSGTLSPLATTTTTTTTTATMTRRRDADEASAETIARDAVRAGDERASAVRDEAVHSSGDALTAHPRPVLTPAGLVGTGGSGAGAPDPRKHAFVGASTSSFAAAASSTTTRIDAEAATSDTSVHGGRARLARPPRMRSQTDDDGADSATSTPPTRMASIASGTYPARGSDHDNGAGGGGGIFNKLRRAPAPDSPLGRNLPDHHHRHDDGGDSGKGDVRRPKR